MGYFGGTTKHPMDTTGRVSFPAKFRRALPETEDLVIVQSPIEDFPSLWIFTSDEFKEWVDDLIEGKGGYQANSDAVNYYVSALYGSMEYIPIDTVGRIRVPVELRKNASLGKEVMIIGAGRRIEIWNEGIRTQYLESQKKKNKIIDKP